MIIVMGTPGAGKSTLIREIKRKHPDLKVVNFGSVMYELAKGMFNVKHRDDMRKLSRYDFRKLQSVAANELVKMGSNIIVDTHASIKTNDGYHPGFPTYVLSKLPVDAYIYIRAPVCDIISRRKRDLSRKRDLETAEDILFHENINLSMVSAYATHSNAPVKFIFNEDGKLDEAIHDFEESVGL